MILFKLPDNVVDRFERGSWLTCPFDLAATLHSVLGRPLGSVVRGHFRPAGWRVRRSFRV